MVSVVWGRKFGIDANRASRKETTMRDLSIQDIEAVHGGHAALGVASGGLAIALGSASFGAGWGGVAVGLAFAVSPLTVVALGGLALYAGYQLASD